MTTKNFSVKRLDVIGSGDSIIESTDGILFMTSNSRVSVSTDFNVIGFTSMGGIATATDFYPPENNSGGIGTTTKVWNNVHANFLHGDAAGITSMVAAGDGTYGSANSIPAITVSANGRISAISTNAITLTAAINANAATGDVGTYAFMQQSSCDTQSAPGDVLAGSSLRYSDATGRVHSTVPSGNWRCMGYDSGAALVNTGSGVGVGTTGEATIFGNVVGNTTVITAKGTGSEVSTDNLNVEGTATINTVTVNSITVNTTVAYSATLWLRYS